jgi:hypothetical protein
VLTTKYEEESTLIALENRTSTEQEIRKNHLMVENVRIIKKHLKLFNRRKQLSTPERRKITKKQMKTGNKQ